MRVNLAMVALSAVLLSAGGATAYTFNNCDADGLNCDCVVTGDINILSKAAYDAFETSVNEKFAHCEHGWIATGGVKVKVDQAANAPELPPSDWLTDIEAFKDMRSVGKSSQGNSIWIDDCDKLTPVRCIGLQMPCCCVRCAHFTPATPPFPHRAH